ncbi:transporter [Ochrobactrum sp. MYb15]|uniref:GntP family permease n=1 Tax=Brucella pituitosa TaxID=571256 RepID=UPI000CFA9B34|nr:transporter [Ochrobactrum sp. MYb19]PRA63260.1 transporter [Ochrobactrum sp. MYb18]PRA73386.1 transporter [Brucella thiophenivorans]PRA88255.1 transporter [Ochrobactrum sp. MYb14]PRA94909.1 transporter [Ochrobactrum sp. MYb15]
MGLLGILMGLALLMWFAYRGWSVLLLSPVAALLAALISGEPLLANWTSTFMTGTASFVARWFPLFLLGGIFGKLMDDSGSITAIAQYMTERLGVKRTMLSVVLASAVVTYGGVSVFVAFFVLVPMAREMFKAANIPARLMPAAIGLGAFTFTMSAMPGTPSTNNAIPMPYFGTTTFAAPGLGIIASLITLAFGMWWLQRAEAKARAAGENYVDDVGDIEITEKAREQSTLSGDFDPAELDKGARTDQQPPFFLALLPLLVVIFVNFLMALIILPRIDFSFLEQQPWGIDVSSSIGLWAVLIALAAAIITLIAVNFGRLRAIRESLDAGANSSVLPILTIASLVGFGAVVAAMPAFSLVRDAVLEVPGGPLVSLVVAMNALAALTGTASGGMAIALNALGEQYMQLAVEYGINPELMHRLTVISAGTLDALPHNGTVLLLLQISRQTHSSSYLDMVMTVIVGVIISLVAVFVLGSMFGSF